METAGNDQFDDDTEKKGLGTPATRAGIIEKLVKSGFAERKGKSLIPTKDGCNLVCVLPEQITSPAMTAEWENTLMEIEQLFDGFPSVLNDGLSLGFELVALAGERDLRFCVGMLLTGCTQKAHSDEIEDFLL